MHHNSTVGLRAARPLMSVAQALDLLRLLKAERSASGEEIQEALGISRATMFRLLGELRMQLQVCVDHDASLGGYRVSDWGVINQRRL